MWRPFFRGAGLALLGVLVMLTLAVPIHGAEKGSAQEESPSTDELKSVVDLLDNPKERDAFLKKLKTLIKARQATGQPGHPKPLEKKEVLAVEQVFHVFDGISREFMDAATATVSMVSRVPRSFAKAETFFSDPKKRQQAFRLLLDVFAAVLISLILRCVFRRYKPHLNDREARFRKKFGTGLARALFNLIPYGALLISLFLLCHIFPSHPKAHVLVITLCLILLLYRVTIEIFRVLLAPDEQAARFLPMDDENANYYWIWVRRMANYTAFYFVLTNVLYVFQARLAALDFVKGVTLIVFPILITVFVLQQARELRLRQMETGERDTQEEKKANWAARFLLRYWPVLVIAYAWAIFILLIVKFEEGYSYLFTSTLGTLAALFATLMALNIKNRLFRKMFAVNQLVRERFPGLEEKTNRYIQIIGQSMDIIIVLIGASVMAEILGFPVSSFVVSDIGSMLILRAIAIVVTIGIVLGVIEVSYLVGNAILSGKVGKRKGAVSQKTKTLIPVALTAVKIGVWFTGGIIILDRLGVNTTPILAGAGIVGLAIGFGSQTLVKDLINGLFILFEESIRIGDWATVGNKGGHVEAIGLRTVRLRDLHGNVHVIPNSSIDTVTNLSKEFSRAVMDVGVAYREDVDKVIEILEEIGKGMAEDPVYGKNILEPLEIFGLDRFEDSSVVIRARFMTKPLKQWGVRREFNRRLKRVFDERGIEIPFPHRTLYMGEPKQGPAPPMEVHLSGGKD
ncbi:MAG: mechanosensitive ion channel [Deltaproteobacteria bacterium]